MSGFLLLRPFWLLALIPVAAVLIWRLRCRASGDWARIADPALLPLLVKLGFLTESRGGRRRAVLPFLAAGILALALSGPALLRPGAVSLRALDPMILLLDLSPSVVGDEKVLADLQAAAAILLAQAEGRPVGVALYAADAYLASAPTSDAASLQGLIAVLSRETMPVAGSRPDMALTMAREFFGGGTGIGGADFVLISDGGGATPRAAEEAARLAHDGARVWALALTRGAPGAPAPDPAALGEIARRGGGALLDAEAAADLPRRIASLRKARLARDESLDSALRDYGLWLLPLAMLAILPRFRRLA